MSSFFFWKWIHPFYREFVAKLGVAFFRFVAAASAVGSKFAVVEVEAPLWQQPWLPTLVIAAIGFFLWEVIGVVGDHKFKIAKERSAKDYLDQIETLEQDKRDAEEQYRRIRNLLSYFRIHVNQKRQRIRRILMDSTNLHKSVPQSRQALSPSEQINFLLEQLASLLHLSSGSNGMSRQNFRVGLYVEESGYLVPIAAFDLNSRKHDPFSSYRHHRDRFCLDNDTNPSHAVRCVRDAQMLIVPECGNHPIFQHFNPQQRQYLQSLVAYPLFDFNPDGTTPVRAALLIDTDLAGHFREEDSGSLKLCLDEFAARLALEYTIKRLVE